MTRPLWTVPTARRPGAADPWPRVLAGVFTAVLICALLSACARDDASGSIASGAAASAAGASLPTSSAGGGSSAVTMGAVQPPTSDLDATDGDAQTWPPIRVAFLGVDDSGEPRWSVAPAARPGQELAGSWTADTSGTDDARWGQLAAILPEESGVRWSPLAWSVDGSLVAVARIEEYSRDLPNGQTQQVATHATIWVADRDGASLRELAEAPSWANQSGVPGYGAWSPGGRSITFAVEPPFPCDSCLAGGLDFYALSVDDGSLLRLGHALLDHGTGPRFAWGPEDRFVVLSSGPGRETYLDKQLVRVDLPSGERRDLSADPSHTDLDPALSPDGQQIAFARGRVSLLPDGSSPQDLPPGMHPNIAAITSRRIWLMDPDGQSAQQLADTPGWTDEAPAWTPDGSWIVFVRWRIGEQGEEGEAQLWAVRPDGTQAHAVNAPLALLKDFNAGFGYYGSFGWRNRFVVLGP